MTIDNKDTTQAVEEPLLTESTSRWCMFPIRYNSIWEYYKKAEASFWTGKILCTVLFSFVIIFMPYKLVGHLLQQLWPRGFFRAASRRLQGVPPSAGTLIGTVDECMVSRMAFLLVVKGHVRISVH
jgi:hypothetical protein